MKARNREINIFNMSLLDILCGALGAFCFMMLTLLPYYHPPGEDISINLEQKKLLDELQDIKDLAERLKFTSNAEDLTELVKKLQEQILALENEIKRLQGHLNALLAENAELKRKVQALEQERQKLMARLDQLETENRELRAKWQQSESERQRLAKENEELRMEKQQLERAVRQKTPWIIAMTPSDPSQRLDCSLHETRLKTRAGKVQPEFDPAKTHQPTFVAGDTFFTIGSSAFRLAAERPVQSARKCYVSLANPASRRARTEVRGLAMGDGMDDIRMAPVVLTPERPWTLVGVFFVPELDRVTFVPATEAEREAEWNRLMNPAASKKDDPGTPSGLTSAEIEARIHEATSAAEEAIRMGSAQMDAAAKDRLRSLAIAFARETSEPQQVELLRKAFEQVTSSTERQRLQYLEARLLPLRRSPKPRGLKPTPGPGGPRSTPVPARPPGVEK